jgi:hypothetical protein
VVSIPALLWRKTLSLSSKAVNCTIMLEKIIEEKGIDTALLARCTRM